MPGIYARAGKVTFDFGPRYFEIGTTMQKGRERVFQGNDLTIYHQNFPKKQLSNHCHKEAHLFIPLQGEVELEVDGVIHNIKTGQMMFIGGSVDHSFSAHREMGERLILQLDRFKLKSRVSILPVNHLLKDLCLNVFSHAQESYSGSLTKLISEVLIATLNNEKKVAQNELFATQQKILSTQNPQLKKLLKILESDLELSMSEVAERSGLSSRTLSRLTNTEIGLSPNELHTYYRIQKASELIFQGNLGLTAIAFECGYSSLSQFIQNFKRWTGSKPSVFKPFQ
jgi:AraC-like DNA-binding protein/quercetin dioxygenase-like cupin family protein